MRRTNQHGRLSTGCAILLAIAAFVLFFLWMRGCWMAPFHDQGSRQFLWLPSFSVYAPLSIWGLIQIGLAIWVGFDANRRGLNGLLWGLLVFFTGIVGLIVYLLIGPTMAQRNGATASPQPAAAVTPVAPVTPSTVCPGCQSQVSNDFKVCPYCGKALRCNSCDKPIQTDWRICPYCTNQL
jgi:RNA polymerase subunit RPABC4/transcription elongation factor Spt4